VKHKRFIYIFFIFIILSLQFCTQLKGQTKLDDTKFIATKGTQISFPNGFLWGASSSAHQVEGNNIHNQWWRFEQDEKITTKDGQMSGIACDHYNRYEEDFNLLKEMNHNVHRLSIEWSRIYPNSPNEINWEAVEHYHKVLDKLNELKIEPMVTAFHITIPQWFADMGGFEKAENIKYFIDFVEFLAKEYGNKVKYWVTINEMDTYAFVAYFVGLYPPGEKDLFKSLYVLRNLLVAHGLAYNMIKEEDPDSIVGFSKVMIYLIPKNDEDVLGKVLSDFFGLINNDIIFDAIANGEVKVPGYYEKLDYLENSTDFVGLNYYTRAYADLESFNKEMLIMGENERVSQKGWAEYPEGIYHCIMYIRKKFGDTPIYITENGLSTDDDTWRIEYIKNHLVQVSRAIQDGANVKGYLYWSNLDNFEWECGYYAKFGLIAVDRENGLKRIPKNSAWVYADIIKNNGFVY